MTFDARRLPTVLTAEELIEKAFRRASKVTGRNRREKALNKLSTMSNVLRDYFTRIITSHPSYDNLDDFYREMVDIVVGLRRIKKSLAALSWADSMTQRVITQGIRRIKGGRDPERTLKEVYGRVASIIEQIDDELRFLNEAKMRLREIPSLTNDFTVVFAGYPNVGKSSIISRISTVKPEVASYPFTTKKIFVGYLDSPAGRIQVIDTPGLLDRPFEKRNKIERRAVLALRHLADVVVFVIDPTESCGFELEKQLSLLEEVREEFDLPVIEIYSKADLHSFRDRRAVSVVTGEGIEELVDTIKSLAEQKSGEKSGNGE
ncbi:small GTP-binding protein domain [Geoglobus ahangari]|uniref:Small GTP-binding protein domain n=1 Tax=Geoglobus ahangari TaxID=113653 RepID=A0A0F7DBU8_9EURY|nr:GTPase [Geoglobus ahangari]AKG91716.1 small GTP-binding protein domain [Geoglobus ahangari]